MGTSYTKCMKKKIDLTDLFQIDEEEEDPLVLNINEMNLEERTLLFDKLYQDYIILVADKKSPVKVVKNYKKLLNSGANYIAISSFIWDNPKLKPEFAIKEFK